MNPKRLRLDFGVYHIRVMRVNEAPPLSQSSPTLDAPEKVYDFQASLVRLRWSAVRPGSSSFELRRQSKKRRLIAERRRKLHPHWKPFC